MRYKHLKNANVDVSSLGIGTWAIGGAGFGEVNEKDSIAAIQAAFDGGVNLIDTAPDYGRGHSEIVVGKALKGYDRSKIFVSTKVCASALTLKAVRTEARYARDGSYADVLYECEQSLRRLDTDYIDFYFVHWPDKETPFSETMEALNKLKEQGKIRFICLSNFNREQIEECQQYAQIDGTQPPYSMVVRRDEELMKWCASQGIGTFTYGSLGAGILSGKYRQIPEFGPRDPRNFFYPFFQEPQFSKVMKVLDVMDGISAETGKPLAQIAINWSTQKDYVTTALCGVRIPEQAVENCATFDWELTDAQIAAIDKAIDENIDFDGSKPVRRT